MNRPLSNAQAPALLWLAVALASSLFTTSPLAHIALAATAALCALSLPQRLSVRLVAAAAMVPVAVADAPAWSFVLAGGILAATMTRPGKKPVPAPLELLQRHLEWCRRRGESAHLLWVHAPGADQATAVGALDAFRVTDNVALLHEGDGNEEIVAMMDDTSFEREGLERRLRAHVGDTAGFGWAAFPEDGVTLEALFQHARAAAVASSSRSTPIKIQPQASFRRWATKTPPGAPVRSSNQG